MRTYGMPYKGSKNKIAEWVVEHLPPADTLYDLFCGGGAITHCAALSGKYKNIVANDIIPGLSKTLVKALTGRLKISKEWVSREEFYKRKDCDPVIAMCWSFGNNYDSYLYAKEIEDWKKALHSLYLYHDKSLCEKMGVILSIDTLENDFKRVFKDECSRRLNEFSKIILDHNFNKIKLLKDLSPDVEQEYLLLTEIADKGTFVQVVKDKMSLESERLRIYLNSAIPKGMTKREVGRRLGTQMEGHYFGKSQWNFPTKEHYMKMQEFMLLPEPYDKVCGKYNLYKFLLKLLDVNISVHNPYSLFSLQSLECLERLERNNITSYNCSYDKILLSVSSVIYCDIPYYGTNKYLHEFDYESFYSWCRTQEQLVIISEYSMPSDFICIAQKKKTCSLSPTNNNCKTIEKLFVPAHQIELYNKMMRL